MPLWLSVILSLLAWLTAIFFTVVLYIFSLVFVLPVSLLVDHGSRRLIDWVSEIWGKAILATSLIWKLEVRGIENIRKDRHYVIVANHQSMLDILVVLAGLPHHFKFIAKKELFSIPFIGWHIALANYIPIDRSSPESGKRAILAARHQLERGTSVLFFPEGTRSPDGEIKAFKTGAFKIARETGTEILPLVICGTGAAVPKHSWKIKKTSHFFLSVGKPAAVRGKNFEDLEKEKEEIRRSMIRRLAEIRRSG